MNTAIRGMQAEVATLGNLGVPIGYGYFPYCQPRSNGTQIDTACAGKERSGFAAWFLSTLLAGLLIGLGAPFWFDLARGLSRSAQLLRAVGVGAKENGELQVCPNSGDKTGITYGHRNGTNGSVPGAILSLL